VFDSHVAAQLIDFENDYGAKGQVIAIAVRWCQDILCQLRMPSSLLTLVFSAFVMKLANINSV
jgi:hypothetical protein